MLKLISSSHIDSQSHSCEIVLAHHQQLLEGYLQSHRIRNHVVQTIAMTRSFLEGWFASHGSELRILTTWEAMVPIEGRKRIVDYGQVLIQSGISTSTIRSKLGMLHRYFAYVLEHPHVLTQQGYRRIQDLYGPIDQPISEYDMPHHVYDGERLGIPLDPERLYDFYAHLHHHYLESGESYRAIKARNYTMLVLASESGLRVDELLHLEISKDLFFESKKLQTRFAKGTLGSGKRARVTLFTPFARDTVHFYLKKYRPDIPSSHQTDFLFPSKSGKLMTYSSAHCALDEMVSVARKTHFAVAPHFSWHWTRRLFATLFIERFPDCLPVLINLLGHQNPNSVHRYIRHSTAWMDQQIQTVLQGVK